MHDAFGGLDNRLHVLGRRCFEPPGQDGYNCLLLAAIDSVVAAGAGAAGTPAHVMRAERTPI